MNFDVVDFIGYGAAVCTTIAFLPQLAKAWRTRSTRDISLGMFLVLTIGIILWLAYGLIKRDVPLVAANAVTLSLAVAILTLKLRFK